MITLQPQSAIPPFEQVRAQLASQIADGMLAAGTRLPPVRKLADDLGLAVNTVARAYRELESAGLVETRGRRGTVVTAAGNQTRELLAGAAHQYAALAQRSGVGAEEAVRLVQAAFSELFSSAEPSG